MRIRMLWGVSLLLVGCGSPFSVETLDDGGMKDGLGITDPFQDAVAEGGDDSSPERLEAGDVDRASEPDGGPEASGDETDMAQDAAKGTSTAPIPPGGACSATPGEPSPCAKGYLCLQEICKPPPCLGACDMDADSAPDVLFPE
jgi:hypothetical protein